MDQNDIDRISYMIYGPYNMVHIISIKISYGTSKSWKLNKSVQTSMNGIKALISSKKKDYWSPYTVQIQNDGPEKDFMNGVSKR